MLCGTRIGHYHFVVLLMNQYDTRPQQNIWFIDCLTVGFHKLYYKYNMLGFALIMVISKKNKTCSLTQKNLQLIRIDSCIDSLNYGILFDKSVAFYYRESNTLSSWWDH